MYQVTLQKFQLHMKENLQESSSTAISREKPLPRADQPPILEHTDKSDDEAKDKDVGHGSVDPIRQPQKTVSIPPVKLGREIAKQLDEAREKSFQIKQLTGQAGPLPEVC